jgi:hypothetical protein
VAIYRLLQNVPLDPEQVEQLTKAYEAALLGLGLRNREDPLTELVARRIFEIRQTGILDPAELAATIIGEFGGKEKDSG